MLHNDMQRKRKSNSKVFWRKTCKRLFSPQYAKLSERKNKFSTKSAEKFSAETTTQNLIKWINTRCFVLFFNFCFVKVFLGQIGNFSAPSCTNKIYIFQNTYWTLLERLPSVNVNEMSCNNFKIICSLSAFDNIDLS